MVLSVWLRRWTALMLLVCGTLANAAFAQAPPAPAPLPIVIGRDSREPAQTIGKEFLLRVWLSNVGGPGIHRIHSVRVASDGTITVPGVAPIKAEGVAISALEQQVAALFKGSSPQAGAWITILERTPPPPPPPPLPPPPPSPPATQAATQPAATKPATQASTQPAKPPA